MWCCFESEEYFLCLFYGPILALTLLVWNWINWVRYILRGASRTQREPPVHKLHSMSSVFGRQTNKVCGFEVLMFQCVCCVRVFSISYHIPRILVSRNWSRKRVHNFLWTLNYSINKQAKEIATNSNISQSYNDCFCLVQSTLTQRHSTSIAMDKITGRFCKVFEAAFLAIPTMQGVLIWLQWNQNLIHSNLVRSTIIWISIHSAKFWWRVTQKR